MFASEDLGDNYSGQSFDNNNFDDGQDSSDLSTGGKIEKAFKKF